MAKNTGSTAFRRVDVDQYAEEKYEDDAVIDDGISGPNESEVQSMLLQGRNVDALQYVLQSAPVGTKNQIVKDKSMHQVLRVLLSFKSADIDNAVRTLDQPRLDTLMKYIYRGFEFPSEGSSAQLLTWHEKVVAVGGLGNIVRVLTDRKRV
jgi:actin related protein 2/3 complex subunit 5